MRQYIDVAQDLSGNALAGATCTVRTFPGGALASIFSDNGLTPIGTSIVTADVTGQFSFYVADGDYTLQLSFNGAIYKTQSPVTMFDGAAQLTYQDTGAANAYAVANSALEKALRVGLRASFLCANTNTGPSTFQYNTLAAKPLVFPAAIAVGPGSLVVGGIYGIEYDGTNWQVKNSATVSNYQTIPAETTAGVAPTNFSYPPFQVARYMSAAQLTDWLNGTAGVDQTSAFVAAEKVAYLGGGGAIYAPGIYRVAAANITLRSGVTVRGDGAGNSEYFPGSPWNTSQVSQIWRKTGDTAGPIFILQTSCGVKGIYFRDDLVGGAGTGVLQIGTASHAVNTDGTNDISCVDLSFYGQSIAAGVLVDATCAAIYFMDGSVANSVTRYGNNFRGIRIQNYAVGIRLGEDCNQNNFTGITIRQTYKHWVLNGGTGTSCIENSIAGSSHFNIGPLPTNPTIVFNLSNGAVNNAFVGYSTECNGQAFSLDASCVNNIFCGYENEAVTPSYVPPGNFHALWTQPNNRSQVSSILLPSVATPLAYTNGQGNLLRIVQNISGTLPQLNGTGALVAADPNSKVFARFNSTLYSKASQPCLLVKLRVAVDAPGGGVGEGVVEVEFWYRATDNSTHAASLSVISVAKKPAANYIAGLKFLTGVAAGLGFGLAVVGGNVGAVTVSHLIVDIEILAFTFSNNAVAMASYNTITWGTAAATANDVTDAIDLLTVADTAV